MSLQTVIVDDEPLALDLLRLLLAEHKDLLFLDVQMPELGGFDVVEQVGLRHLPPTIFVTAYHEHAVRAFDVHAVDYLTKPVETERLGMALERVRKKIAAETALMTQEQLTAVLTGLRSSTGESKTYVSRFLVRDGEKEIVLSVDRIDWIEAADYYCCLHSKGRGYMLRETISELNNKLDPRQFVRVHRSSIVNLDQIREIHRDGQTEGSVVLLSGQAVRMSRAGRQKLSEIGKL
jgi:two-component system, LytTR family, response regulator